MRGSVRVKGKFEERGSVGFRGLKLSEVRRGGRV